MHGLAPQFWRHGGPTLLPSLLWPLSHIVAQATARRVARPGWLAPVPVVCCGNAGVGGAGKTTLVLDLCARLRARGLAVHVLTRGHGGRATGPLRVDPARHGAREVGDEALLLAGDAPTWLGADRAATARLAVAERADILLMDDGLQNPTLRRTGLLVIDGPAGFGNGRVLPAGPLREPVEAAASRCLAAVLIGNDATGALARLPPHLPVLRATLTPGPELAALAGHRVVAFAGIGRPEKFFTMLEQAGLDVVRRVPFPDHHLFRPAELTRMADLARAHDAWPVTTPKDHVRLSAPDKLRFVPVGVSLVWGDGYKLDALLDRLIQSRNGSPV